MIADVMSPINDVTKLDLLVERQDGGVEMCIVAQSSVDGSQETLLLIEEKVGNYVREALDRSFRERYGNVPVERVQIFFESRFAVDPAALSVLSRLAAEVAKAGLSLQFREYRASV